MGSMRHDSVPLLREFHNGIRAPESTPAAGLAQLAEVETCCRPVSTPLPWRRLPPRVLPRRTSITPFAGRLLRLRALVEAVEASPLE